MVDDTATEATSSNSQLNFLGDYFGFLFDGTKLRVAWSDPRNGSDAQVVDSGGSP